MHKTNKSKRYEAPKAELIAIEHQGVLCASGGAASMDAGANGGINGMSNGNTYGW